MKLDTESTKVIFRADKRDGEIIAIFPASAGTNDPYTCSCYVHMGQHGSASLDYVRQRTRPATPTEYRDLKRELRSIGYRLKIAKRMTRADDNSRLAQVHR